MQIYGEFDIGHSEYSSVESKLSIPSSFNWYFQRIKNGTWRDVTENAQKFLGDKNQYDKFRAENAPCVTPGVRITGRGKDSYTEADLTGLMVLDVDDKREDHKLNKQRIINHPSVVGIHTSISGRGLAVFVKCDPTRFKDSYASAIKIFAALGVTVAKGQDNPNRVRYVSYDPEAWWNPEPAKAPNIEILEFAKKSTTSHTQPKADNDRPEIFLKMVEVKSEGENIWREGDRHRHIRDISSWANHIGMSMEYCLQMMETYCRPMLQNGHDYDIESKVKDIFNRYESQHNTKFWESTTRTVSGLPFCIYSKKGPNIQREKLMRTIEMYGGFHNYCPDKRNKTSILIRKCGTHIEEATSQEIKAFLVEFINQSDETKETKEEVLELLYRGADSYFSKAALEFLSPFEPDFLKHTAKLAFYPFRNGIVEVSENLVRLIPYDQSEKHIWKSEIIDFDIKPFDLDAPDESEFWAFIRLICNHDYPRMQYAMSIIGYLLHTYKDPAKPFAIILAEETEDEEEGGGTGKGIFIVAISKLINAIKIDGKNFKSDKSFAMQRVRLDSRLIAIEDVRKNVDFEGFYSIITEGLTIERKNKDEVFIPYENSPKIIFTTNYTIAGKGNHGKRRQKVLEFSNFFSPDNTPEDYFGHRLFNDWDKDEWNRFYNFLFGCVSLFMKSGIMDVNNSLSNKKKQVKLSYSPEFLEWWDRYSSNGCHEWKLFSSMYNDFLGANDLDKKDYSMMKFKKGIDEAAKIFGLKLERGLSKDPNNRNKPQYRVVSVNGVEKLNNESVYSASN